MKIRYGFLSIVFALSLVVFPAGAVDLSGMTKEKCDHIRKIKLNSDKPLILAARKGDFEEVKRLVEKGADVNVKDVALNTPLIAAVTVNHTEMVKYLLEKGASVEDKDYDFSYSYSSFYGNVSYDFHCYESSVLFIATYNGNYEVAKMILDRGADVNDINGSEKRTALYEAALLKNSEIVRLLLDYGASINIKDEHMRKNVFHATVDGLVNAKKEKEKRLSVLKQIVADGDEKKYANAGKGMTEEELEKEAFRIFKKKVDEHNLKQSIKADALEMFKYVTENGLNAEAEQDIIEAEKILKMLIRVGYVVGNIDEFLGYALIDAASYNNVEGVRLLLKYGANVNFIRRKSTGDTALMSTSEKEIVQMLLDNGADINAINYDGNTALISYVANAADIELIEILINNGADMDVGGRALRLAYALYDKDTEDEQAFDLLLERGANVNIQDSFLGRSILMQAVIDENVEMVKKLLRKGANKRLRDHNNETALMMAEYNGNNEIINLLQ